MTSRLDRARWRHGFLTAIAVLAFVTATGCYETKYQVFSREDSVVIPGLEGRYTYDDHEGKLAYFTMSRTGSGNDYRFSGIGCEKSEIITGVFRAVPVGDGLFVAQVTPGSRIFDGDHHGFVYKFFRVVMQSDGVVGKIEQLETMLVSGKPEERERTWKVIQTIARRDAVDVWKGQFGPDGLGGSPRALKQFLLDVAKVPFMTQGVYLRTRRRGEFCR